MDTWLRTTVGSSKPYEGGPRQTRIVLATPDGSEVVSLEVESAIRLAHDLLARVLETGR